MSRVNRKSTGLKKQSIVELTFDQIIQKQQAFFQPACDIFSSKPTQDQLESIIPILTQINFFKQSCPQNMSIQDFVRSSIDGFQYEYLDKGQAVFHLGDQGNKFFILLQGVAGVYVPKDQQKIKEEDQKREKILESKRKSLLDLDNKLQNYLAIKLGKNDQEIEDEFILQKVGRKDKYFTSLGTSKYIQVARIIPGQSFGEIALTTDKPRGASIIAKTNLQMVSMKKNDYKKVSYKFEQMLKQKIELFMRLLPGTLKMEIQKFIQYFTEISFFRNQIIWEEGDNADCFMLIKSGNVEIIKSQQENQKNLILKIVSEDNFIGDDDVLFRRQKRFYGCRCKNNVQVFKISNKDFNYVRKYYGDIERALRLKCILKDQWLNERLDQLLKKRISISNIQIKKTYSEERITPKQIQELDQKQFAKENQISKVNEMKLKLGKIISQGNSVRSQYVNRLNKDEIVRINNTLNQKLQTDSSNEEINFLNKSDPRLRQNQTTKSYLNHSKSQISSIFQKEFRKISKQKVKDRFREQCVSSFVKTFSDYDNHSFKAKNIIIKTDSSVQNRSSFLLTTTMRQYKK